MNVTLFEQEELWKTLNPNEDFWIGVEVPKVIDRQELIDYLLYEYGELETVDNHSGHFRNHIKNFFKIHKWNIEKLAKTLEFEYNPIEDTKWHEWYDVQDDKSTDSAGNKVSSTNEEIDSTEDETWHEHDDINSTKVNYVSAFNMDLSPKGNKLDDSEHHRDTEHTVIDKDGTDNTIGHTTDGTSYDEDTTSHTFTDNDIHKDTYHHGNDRNTFQSLIEEERKQSLFNIYKWIGKHFSTELLICLW